jgi:5-hydroxyisourate hydrolase-like protein (transthyretin family)
MPLRLFRLVSLLLVSGVLVACTAQPLLTPGPTPQLPPLTVVVERTPVPTTTPVSALPTTLRVVGDKASVLPGQCRPNGAAFDLVGVDLPLTGLQPGQDYRFCARHVPPETAVRFVLRDPEGNEQTFVVTAAAQEGGGVAVLTWRPGPDDRPGRWRLRAEAGENSRELDFRLREAGAPFLVLREPPSVNPEVLHAAVGGLPPRATARFAFYRLGEDGLAEMLISIGLTADDRGRADLELDVADLAAGRYLLLLVPADVKLGEPATLDLAAQGRLAVVTAITRTAAAAGPVLTIEPAASGGGLPERLRFDLPAVALPACEPAPEPILRLWPADGTLGTWWLGCAAGFAANETIELVIADENNEQTVIPLTAGPEGTVTFRWYSLPGEATGAYRVVANTSAGLQSAVRWQIEEARQPRVLVFPHAYRSEVGGELALAGFPPTTRVELGLYRLDAQGEGVLVRSWQLRTDRKGAVKKAFEEAFGLEPGQYAVVAQGGPAFTYPGIPIALSAVDFFGYDEPPAPAFDAYSLFVGRTPGMLTPPTLAGLESLPPAETPSPTATPAEVVATPTPEPTATPTPEPTAAPLQPPAVVTLPAAPAELPTCPGAGAGPIFCLLPTTLEQGSFAYMMAHGFPARTSIQVSVRMPNGQVVRIADRADGSGFADFHWYALPGEPLGDYRVTARGGNQTFAATLTVVAARGPRVVVQPRLTTANAGVVVGLTGFAAGENLVLVRYGGADAPSGTVELRQLDRTEVTTDAAGNAIRTLSTRGARPGQLYLVAVFRAESDEALAQAVYAVGQPLHLRYPFGWGQNLQEGQ